MEKKQAHLQMIQGIVNRLSNNSSLIKGWSVILVSALFALAANNENARYIYLAYFPSIAFWALDGYFLWRERLFRQLFDHVRNLREEQIDYSMDVSEMSKAKYRSWLPACISMTLLLFHGAILIIISLMLILYSKERCNGAQSIL